MRIANAVERRPHAVAACRPCLRLAARGAVVAAFVVLTGCAEVRDLLPAEEPAPGEPIAPVVAEQAKPMPMPQRRYCYRTLGTVDCYAKPLPDAESRRVDWFDSADYD